jgi:hypothetical protein
MAQSKLQQIQETRNNPMLLSDHNALKLEINNKKSSKIMQTIGS